MCSSYKGSFDRTNPKFVERGRPNICRQLVAPN
jgi:hypothetical protein